MISPRRTLTRLPKPKGISRVSRAQRPGRSASLQAAQDAYMKRMNLRKKGKIPIIIAIPDYIKHAKSLETVGDKYMRRSKADAIISSWKKKNTKG